MQDVANVACQRLRDRLRQLGCPAPRKWLCLLEALVPKVSEIRALSVLWLFSAALNILEVATHFFDSLAILGRIAVGKEMRVAIMSALNSPRVPDRAPVLFGSPRDFHDVCQQSVGIGTVQTIEALERVQIL